MRMDIEISPGAPAQLSDTAARDNWSRALGDGGIQEKRCCSNGHFAIWRERRVRRFSEERAGSVLRHHSSVNLVSAASVTTGRGASSSAGAEDRPSG
jgi:hypothetical protein